MDLFIITLCLRVFASGNQAAADGCNFVLAMLRIYAHCEGMVTELFARNLNFQKALQAAFHKFINENASKQVELSQLFMPYAPKLLTTVTTHAF